jgi:hypothetical protein
MSDRRELAALIRDADTSDADALADAIMMRGFRTRVSHQRIQDAAEDLKRMPRRGMSFHTMDYPTLIDAIEVVIRALGFGLDGDTEDW